MLIKRSFALVMTCILFPAFASGGETITLKDSAEIADAIVINKAIDRVSNRAMECIDKKLAPVEKCYCLYPKEIASFKQKTTLILQKHPNWEGKSIFWELQNDPRGYGYNLSIPGIRTQMKMTCK